MVSDWEEHFCPPPEFSVCAGVTGRSVPEGRLGMPAKPQEHPRSPYDPPSHRAGFLVYGSIQHAKHPPCKTPAGDGEDFGLVFAKPHVVL